MFLTPQQSYTLSTIDVVTPPSPTGQYPDAVWADVDYSALGEAATLELNAFGVESVEVVPAPPSATGQYPEPVWAGMNGEALAQTAAFQTSEAVLFEAVPTPPSPTGQYPDAVWSEIDGSRLAQTAANTNEPANSHSPTIQPGPSAALPDVGVSLDHQEMYQIIRAVAAGISGDALYEWNDDSQVSQEGIRVGLVGFRQSRGEVGVLLEAMRRRDPSLFAVTMGAAADELIQTTTADSREMRLQPVGGYPLWHEEWRTRFRQAGQQPAFQAAQNETAIEQQLRPMLPLAHKLGLHSARGLAILYDRVVAMGLAAAVAWVGERLGGQGSEEQRIQILLGSANSDRLNRVYSSHLLDDTVYTLESESTLRKGNDTAIT